MTIDRLLLMPPSFAASSLTGRMRQIALHGMNDLVPGYRNLWTSSTHGPMRIFIGTAIARQLADSIKKGAEEQLKRTHWREAPMEQWHVTSLFVGDRESSLMPRIEEQVRTIAARTPPIVLQNGRLVTMPKDAPTMLWVRFMPSTELTRLHLALAAAIGAAPSTYRPYWPHITLARSRYKQVMPVDGDVLVKVFRLDQLTLFRSVPGPDGTNHSPISTWDLSGTDPAGHGTEA